MSRTTELAASVLALALLAAGTAAARISDRNQPMDIEAARSDCGLGENATCTFSGQATITQGTLRIVAEKAVVTQVAGKPSRAQFSGGVTLQQEMDDGDHIDARSASVDYDMRSEVIVFTGNVNTWGNFLVSNAQTAAADAHYGVATTWDYFKTQHGRNGIADDGVGAISRVHYGRNYGNAFWNDTCFCMTFGDGSGTSLPLVALDIAGHEMSHGVTSRSADLVYSGESGGLNEATSDIFGTMVEYYANNSNDPGDYVIGEKLYANNAALNNAIRWMFKPSLEGAGRSQDCYGPTTGSIDVHFSSGPANHFFYLLAEGAVVPAGFGAGSWANLTPAKLVCNGNTAIAGIGRDAAGKIWYRALTVYMTSSTDYAGARAATISASTDLYGATSAQTNAVKAAWSAVSVN